MAQYLPNKTVQMAHVVNLISIAMLDGEITEAERDLVFQIAGDFGLTQEEFDKCIEISQKTQGQVVYQAADNDRDNAALLKNLALMMMIDGKIDERERQYLVIVAEKFGYDGEKLVDVLIRSIDEDIQRSINSASEPQPNNTSSTETTEMSEEEFKAEIQKRIQAGKEALAKHNLKEAFEQLFVPSLVDGHGARLMLKLLAKYQRVRVVLTKEAIQKFQVEEFAEKNYPLAQYILGRYHHIVKPDKDSITKAKKWYDEAKKANIGDALSGEAAMVLDGYYNMVDYKLYDSLLLEGYEKGYTNDYCSLSLYNLLHNLIRGNYTTEANPQGVVDTIKQAVLGSNESDDIDVVDPVYYQLLANAYVELGNTEAAVHYYTKAIDMGCVECYSTCLILSIPDENSTHEAWETWKQLCLDGANLGDPFCYSLYAVYNETDYDDLSEMEKRQRTKELKEYLNRAYEMGDEFAAYLIGSNHYYGTDGFEKDNDLAWSWLSSAAFWEDGTAYGLLAQMIEEGYKSEQFDQTWADHFYLQALRRGDDGQIEKVVEIYRAGRLTEFAKEIETLYIPKYEQQGGNPEPAGGNFVGPEPERDRKLIAIVKTDGTADILEFDVENWDEMPGFVDADRLDAIRVQPLYDISKKLGYSEHITGWVDNKGMLRNLPSNPIGCKIYPGNIVGDMILTVEDEKYHPMSFTNLDDLKQVIADLGAKLVNIFLD